MVLRILILQNLLYVQSQVDRAEAIAWLNHNVHAALTRQNKANDTLGKEVDVVDDITVLIDKGPWLLFSLSQIISDPRVQTCRIVVLAEYTDCLEDLPVYIQVDETAQFGRELTRKIRHVLLVRQLVEHDSIPDLLVELMLKVVLFLKAVERAQFCV